jgi:putative methanogenesis marker protein 3
MIAVHLDGEEVEIEEGSMLRDLLPGRDPECIVAIIRPTEQASAETRNFTLLTTAGEVVVEMNERLPRVLEAPDFAALAGGDAGPLGIGWSDRYTASFGPFATRIVPARAPRRYEKGDLILGCGGYDPGRSYLIFARMNHSADLGAEADGGVIGRVVSGHAVLARWAPGDQVTAIERVLSWEDRSQSFTTKDPALLLEDGMHIISRVVVAAEGYDEDLVETASAVPVEHMLLALEGGTFRVARSSSNHIMDDRLQGTDIPQELKSPRLEGTVTLRTQGKSRGCLYLYTRDLPGSPAHTGVGRIEHGIELARLAESGDVFCIETRPRRLELLGISVSEAEAIAGDHGIVLSVDETGGDRIVVGQDPATTLEVAAKGSAHLTTVPAERVIGIRLDDAAAPRTCAIFREFTGLKLHNVGAMPFFFNFEDVFLFKPKIPKGTKINLENMPAEAVPPNTLAMTNDSRKGSGLVGVRTKENREFGPTSEPFEGTNVIGTVVDVAKLKDLKEGGMVYIREVPE